MAVWRRKPKDKVLIHSDQSSQFTSMDWASFLKHHNLVHSMSRRGNCHDNAVAESFFNLLKREQIRRKVYRSRDEARQDVFDYIEMFYNQNANKSGYETRGYSVSPRMPGKIRTMVRTSTPQLVRQDIQLDHGIED